MKAKLLAVVDELKRLREDGVDSVVLPERTLQSLRESVAKQQEQGGAESTAANVADSAPVAQPQAPERSAFSEPKPANTDGVSADVFAQMSDAPAADKPKAKPAARTGHPGLPDFVKPIPAPTPFTLPGGDKQSRWDWLKDKVLGDPVCNEHVAEGQKVVLGVGDLDADIFFCGEAPGKDEAIQGEPFVGKAGELLNKIISAMGLKREQVYIGNILNWRPEHDKPFGDRKPVEVEMAYCLPHLKAQIEIVQPKVIVALGATAVDGLFGFGEGRGITKKRGQWREFAGIPTILSYHPSYVLRQQINKVKREIWEDMLAVMEKVELPVSDKQRGFFQ